jgi:hypothetical protein
LRIFLTKFELTRDIWAQNEGKTLPFLTQIGGWLVSKGSRINVNFACAFGVTLYRTFRRHGLQLDAMEVKFMNATKSAG